MLFIGALCTQTCTQTCVRTCTRVRVQIHPKENARTHARTHARMDRCAASWLAERLHSQMTCHVSDCMLKSFRSPCLVPLGGHFGAAPPSHTVGMLPACPGFPLATRHQTWAVLLSPVPWYHAWTARPGFSVCSVDLLTLDGLLALHAQIEHLPHF